MTNKHDAEMYELEVLGMKDVVKILDFVISKRSGNV